MGNFNLSILSGGGGGSGSGSGIAKYPTAAALPGTAADGDVAIVLDTNNLYSYDSGVGGWVIIGGPGVAVTVSDTNSIDTAFLLNDISSNLRIPPGITGLPVTHNGITLQILAGASPGLAAMVQGYPIYGSTSTAWDILGSTTAIMGGTLRLTIQDASSSNPGIVTQFNQSFSGIKFFNSQIVGFSGIGIVSGGPETINVLAPAVVPSTYNLYLPKDVGSTWGFWQGNGAGGVTIALINFGASSLTGITGPVIAGPGVGVQSAVMQAGGVTLANLAAAAYGSSSVAGILVSRDSSSNSYANNFVSATSTVVSAAGTTVLTPGAARKQILTGTLAQTFKMMPANQLGQAGAQIEFNNNSTGLLTVTDNSNGAICTIPPGGMAYVYATDISSPAGVWDVHYIVPSSNFWGTAGLTLIGSLSGSTTGLFQGNLQTNQFLQFGGGSLISIGSTASAGYTLILPFTQGSTQTVLKNNGLGILSWGTDGTIGGDWLTVSAANGTATANTRFIGVTTTTADRSVSIDFLAGLTGVVVAVQKLDSGLGNVLVGATLGINGASIMIMQGQWTKQWFVSTGSGFYA